MKSFPSLTENEALIWCGQTGSLLGKMAALRRVLTDDECQNASRFRFEEDRARFILARGCLRLILGEYLGRPPGEVRVEYTPYGKPEVSTEPSGMPLHFNVSHSGEYFLIALSRQPVGIDIELHHPRPHLQQIAHRFFSPPEWRHLEHLADPHQMQGFFCIWTRKEAFIKGVGHGLSYPLRAFSVMNTEGPVDLLTGVDESRSESPGWFVQDLTAPAGYSAAVATLGGRLLVTHHMADELIDF